MTKLCLTLEAFRRTDEGRIRDAKAFLTHFFPQDKSGAKDRIFLHMPNEVRADLLSNWGIRGKKSALRDDDDRVRSTVNDALNAGDIDATVIEEGISPEILTDWVPLEDWWLFWRGSNLPVGSVRKALASARDLSLFDERWFFEHLALKSAKLDGIDVVCSALSKEQIVAWMSAVHTSGDASPYGLVTAVGWETILAKTPHEGLLFALDALARQIGLAESGPEDRKSEAPRAKSEPPRPKSSVPPAPVHVEPPTKPTAAPVVAESAPSPRAKSEPPPGKVIPEPAPTPRNDTPAAIAEPSPEPPPAKVEAKPAKPAAIPISTKTPEVATSKPPPVPSTSKGPPPIPAGASKAPPPVPSTSKGPPPIPAGASKAPAPPPVPSSKPPGRSIAPQSSELPSVIIEEDPFFPPPPAVTTPSSQVPAPPASTPPNARSLFLGAAAEPPPMRPPAATIVGVAPQGVYGLGATDDVAMPTFTVPPSEPAWAPAKAEPGDMGWDLVHGVTRPMGTNVQPKYNFEDDDEPTSEINLPGAPGRR